METGANGRIMEGKATSILRAAGTLRSNDASRRATCKIIPYVPEAPNFMKSDLHAMHLQT
jgi:hypothetical protein